MTSKIKITRHDVINSFITERGFHSFLEIGTDKGLSLRNVHAKRIVSVDPDMNTPATHHMTSDQYFAEHSDKFDIIFIDGLHECHQAYRDIHYALRDHLNRNGIIVIHDCLPTTKHMQEHHTTSQNYEWTGDVWKAFVRSRAELPYEMYTIDTDYGCGIIDTSVRKATDTSALPTDMDSMSYNDFVMNRDVWMNVRQNGKE